jgi:hypothetical protein
MIVFESDSPAFHKALLESERRRIYGITAFLSVFAVAIAVRILIFGSHMSRSGVFVLLAVVAYELWTLSVVTKALKTGAKLSKGLLLFNIILEMVVPALGVAFFSSPRLAFDYRPIATPWVLAFFPLLMLSVLRINPRVSQFAGVVAVVGYWRVPITWDGVRAPKISRYTPRNRRPWSSMRRSCSRAALSPGW